MPIGLPLASSLLTIAMLVLLYRTLVEYSFVPSARFSVSIQRPSEDAPRPPIESPPSFASSSVVSV